MLAAHGPRLLLLGACHDQSRSRFPLDWCCFYCLLLHIVRAQEGRSADASVPTSQTFALTDTKDLVVEPGVKAEAVEYRGRKAVRLTKTRWMSLAIALVNGMKFHDGTIEVDIATKVTTPPGAKRPGFTGIAFRARPDASHYELFYLRPGNSRSEDQAKRNHSVQYVFRAWFRLGKTAKTVAFYLRILYGFAIG